MGFKNIIITCSILSSLIISCNVMSAEKVDYSYISNKYKQEVGTGKDKCLRTFANGNSVSVGDCDAQGGESDYTSMRLWQVVEESNGFYLLKNRYKNEVSEGKCLRTFSGRNEVEMGNCDAQGDEYDYSSMRLWKIVENGKYALLQNKYKNDVEKPSCLRTFNKSNKSSLIGDCTAKGGSSDYTSMRQWLSNAFPFEQPWSPTGIININYTIPGAPKLGFDSVSFPINIDGAPERKGFYYAMQYSFINGNSGYIGLQPRDKSSGLAIFSVFGNGVKPIASHCTGSADGGAGSSCSKSINLIFGHKYNLTVKRDSENNKVWRGYVEDTVTGEVNEIGAWQPKDSSEGIKNSSVGFVEYTPEINSCSKIPYTKVFFGSPIANSDITGSLKRPSIYGKCKNLVESSSEESTDGWNVSLKGIK